MVIIMNRPRYDCGLEMQVIVGKNSRIKHPPKFDSKLVMLIGMARFVHFREKVKQSVWQKFIVGELGGIYSGP